VFPLPFPPASPLVFLFLPMLRPVFVAPRQPQQPQMRGSVAHCDLFEAAAGPGPGLGRRPSPSSRGCGCG
jgi:hypothetical protein